MSFFSPFEHDFCNLLFQIKKYHTKSCRCRDKKTCYVRYSSKCAWFLHLTCSDIFWRSKIPKWCARRKKKDVQVVKKNLCTKGEDLVNIVILVKFYCVGADLVYQNILTVSSNYNWDFLDRVFRFGLYLFFTTPPSLLLKRLVL